MQNESSRFGERVAALEERFEHVIRRLNHLDEGLDDAKAKASANFILVEKNFTRWERRWLIGIGIVIGVTIAAGGGTISLKSLIELLSKVH